jgi:hypothetical protein
MSYRFFVIISLVACSMGSNAQEPQLRISKTDLGYNFTSEAGSAPDFRKWGHDKRLVAPGLDKYATGATAGNDQFIAIWPLESNNTSIRAAHINNIELVYNDKPIYTVDLTGNALNRKFLAISLKYLKDEVPSGSMVSVRITYVDGTHREYFFTYENMRQPCFDKDSVRRLVMDSCKNCCDDNLIVYDARCKKLYTLQNGKIREIKQLSQVKVHYNRALKFLIIRVNRYLNNISLDMDDISNVSSAPTLISTYLLGGSGAIGNMAQGIGSAAEKNGNPGGLPNKDVITNAGANLTENQQQTVDDLKVNAPVGAEFYKVKTKLPNNFSTDILLKPGLTDSSYALHYKILSYNRANDLALLKPSGNKVPTNNNVNAAVASSLANSLFQQVGIIVKSITVSSFLADLFSFKRSYDSLVDDQIRAYSICSDSFPCCSPGRQKTFSDLDLQLFNLDTEYVALKQQLSKLDANATQKPPPAGQNPPPLTCCVVCMTCSGASTDADNKSKSGKGATTDPNAALDSLWATFKKVTQQQMINLILFHNNLVKDNLSFMSAPIYPQGEGLNVNLAISTMDTAAKLGVPMQNDQTHFNLVVISKPEFGFSAGTFYAWGNNFRYTKYEYLQVPSAGVVQTNSPYKLMPSGTASNVIGADALANIGYKVCTAASLGLSAGIGVTIESKPRVAYLLGFTTALGNIQQFYFSIGWAVLPVNTLKSDQNPNANVFYATNPGDIQYNSKLKTGGFVSLSYTLFKTKSTKYGSYTASPKAKAAPAGKGGNGMPSVSFQFNSGGSGGSGGTPSSGNGSSDPKKK